MCDPTRQGVLFADSFGKPVAVAFDTASQSSDAGLVLLGAIDRRLRLTDALCDQFADGRQAGKIEHSLHDLLRQRVYSIAAGYADGNDAHGLRHDPVLKMLCDRDAVDGAALASQPTLSRFENTLSARDVVRAGRRFESERIARFARRHPKAPRVIIDLDSTEDPTHGQQTFSFFNGFYDSYCFLPLVGFISVEGETEQEVFFARLCPSGNAA